MPLLYCGDLHAAKGESLEDVLAISEKHGFTAEQNQKVNTRPSKNFSGTPGNAMGIAPDYGVWLNGGARVNGGKTLPVSTHFVL